MPSLSTSKAAYARMLLALATAVLASHCKHVPSSGAVVSAVGNDPALAPFSDPLRTTLTVDPFNSDKILWLGLPEGASSQMRTAANVRMVGGKPRRGFAANSFLAVIVAQAQRSDDGSVRLRDPQTLKPFTAQDEVVVTSGSLEPEITLKFNPKLQQFDNATERAVQALHFNPQPKYVLAAMISDRSQDGYLGVTSEDLIPDGKGFLLMSDGSYFQGSFKTGNLGTGVFVATSGMRYEGTFAGNKLDGSYVVTYPSRNVYRQVYSAGSFVSMAPLATIEPSQLAAELAQGGEKTVSPEVGSLGESAVTPSRDSPDAQTSHASGSGEGGGASGEGGNDRRGR